MELKKLLEGLHYEIIKGKNDGEVKNVNYDSRKVLQGDLFVCIKGFTSDGHKFASKAIENGAKYIVCEEIVDCNDDITLIKVEDSRKALAVIGSNFYENPKDKLKIIGVTGTNGKTTTAFMIKSILENAGKKVGLIGTIANYIGDKKLDTERTTPESLELHELFSKMVKENVEFCVMEISSHSLELDRVYGIRFQSGLFTNLTRDHLDFHKTFENYYKAKFKLFPRSEQSIINIDTDWGKRVVEDLEALDIKNYKTYSLKEGNIIAKDIVEHGMDTKFTVDLDGEKEEMLLPIPGNYNIYNALGAILACKNAGLKLREIKEGLKDVSVPGRCERVMKNMNLPYEILIDYAHTPDGLLNILETCREFTKGRLISVFGCGGDRDKLKRPEMGDIGTRLSDIAIITSDNPRTEDEESIIEDIIKGVKEGEYIKITNRREAIKKALEIAKKDDVILIAGKGHETYQILKTGKIHFDEREVIEEILKKN
ncbi:UDP-N-acetylmuramoyl-L-alanyl-D-glutamate--2,6-diaminopimelate ligase [Clostridium thermobutyricum]|uniref:UDP-N-acetylmuramoyl-L-alanyl-D-glutamate--2,6-diaminopimelate ligase n=1 Tax=Clostridium thermobutyricum DSM 4928 TaxID=1121339 RepID=A0A1V4SX85_9CLOT|nr:UDP-N-acetylmuramoyl-L-alanyl-D-glutamate--2,6-diaminopimelate ligase [Clostridium thermobutyricum]OPX47958.1 UDP-N-acetylmuramoyl-L-alanyl-D-glutamate--2,6-diaminopimelate ligase [Clostridium thermobutyricum DSM 4928]